MISSRIVRDLIFWGSWLLIPLLWEYAVGLISAVVLFIKRVMKQAAVQLPFYPLVSVLIPVYNSEKTLELCLQSVAGQEYPADKLEVLLLNNGKRDESYTIFQRFQERHPNIRVRWYDAVSGKSKALNKGISNCCGKYIVNIDSDGWLDSRAIGRLVNRFEADPAIASMTGVILIDPELIDRTENPVLKQIQCCEQFEYMESFLVGRNFHSLFNSMYTLAGACSAFRRDALMRTSLYNFETVGEDTHMTFQIRESGGGRIVLCPDAFFYVDPIEGLDKLYAQRQRWQRGQLEVGKLFMEMHLGSIHEFFTKFSLRILISDHTLAFPRLIWIFGMIYMYFNDYPLKLLLGANALLYLLYVLNSSVFLLVSVCYLTDQHAMRRFALKNGLTVFWLPVFRFIVYWMRIAGIINSVTTEAKWNRKSFSDEVGLTLHEFRSFTGRWIAPLIRQIDRRLNNE